MKKLRLFGTRLIPTIEINNKLYYNMYITGLQDIQFIQNSPFNISIR